MYVFTLQGGTRKEDFKLISWAGASDEKFGWVVAVSRDTLLVGDSGKYSLMGAAYAFILTEGY